MGFLPQVTCTRCHRSYSGLRARCPHCRTKRVRPGDRPIAPSSANTPGTEAGQVANENARWQMLFGIIVVTAVILAVLALVIISIGTETPGGGKTSPSPSISIDPSPSPSPTPTPSPTPGVESISILSFGVALPEPPGFVAKVGSQTELTARVYPLHISAEVEWKSENEEVFTVKRNGESEAFIINALKTGDTYLVVSCGGVSVRCHVIITN